jgi:hypothetical protein
VQERESDSGRRILVSAARIEDEHAEVNEWSRGDLARARWLPKFN